MERERTSSPRLAMGFDIGTCVETTLGTGVVVDFRAEDDVHVVRLWKPRGM